MAYNIVYCIKQINFNMFFQQFSTFNCCMVYNTIIPWTALAWSHLDFIISQLSWQ